MAADKLKPEAPCQACGRQDWNRLFEREGHDYYRCPSCGQIVIHPQPDDQTLADIYGRHYYQAWGLENDSELVKRQKKDTFRHWLGFLPPPSPGDKLLDVGAATGFLLEEALSLGYEVYGSEFSDYGAEALAGKFGPDRVVSGAFDKRCLEKYGPEQFTAITMTDFLEHCRDALDALTLAAKLLKPGGRLLITTPDSRSLSCRLMGRQWLHFKTEHLNYQSRAGLNMLLSRAGLTSYNMTVAVKVVSLAYLGHQFAVYHRPLLSRLITGLGRGPVRMRRLKVFFGEMMVIAVKA